MISAIIVALLCALILSYAYLLFRLVGDRPRTWQYRSAPLIPAESYLSSQPVPESPAPVQVELPPATVGKKAK